MINDLVSMTFGNCYQSITSYNIIVILPLYSCKKQKFPLALIQYDKITTE